MTICLPWWSLSVQDLLLDFFFPALASSEKWGCCLVKIPLLPQHQENTDKLLCYVVVKKNPVSRKKKSMWRAAAGSTTHSEILFSRRENDLSWAIKRKTINLFFFFERNAWNATGGGCFKVKVIRERMRLASSLILFWKAARSWWCSVASRYPGIPSAQ